MLYRSKPHTIRAFQFKPSEYESLEKPEWFEDARTINRVQVTINDDDQYIAIYDDHGGCRKAHADDWVCINPSDNIFPLMSEEFNRGFELDDMR